MCKPTNEQARDNATMSTAEVDAVKYVQPPNPPRWKKALFFPLWITVFLIHNIGMIWFLFGIFAVSHPVNFVLDKITFGMFDKMLCEFLNPKDGEPKSGLAKYISEMVLNKKENYVHFAAIVYITFGVAFHIGSIVYMRANDIGGWFLPLFCHLYYMGAVFPSGINDLHYVAHTQISNNQKSHMFKSELINGFCRFVLEPCQGFIPEFWLNHHVRVHHKESNGPDDIQGVSFFERKYYNYIWFVADIPLQWYLRGPLHHIRNGESEIAIQMFLGEFLYVAAGIALTRWDTFAGLLLVWIPHIIRSMNFNASNEYVQHALVDGRDGNPHDPANNSFLMLQPAPTSTFARGLWSKPDNFEERWHAVHHNFPHKGMVGQVCANDESIIYFYFLFPNCLYHVMYRIN